MTIPEPPVALDGICSVIYENVLYTYSAGAFQSLALEEGAKWKKLTQGEPVSGGVCVGSNPKDPSQAGLYIVGGRATSDTYPGLQKYTYATGKWETITLRDRVTQNRTLHGATYLPGTDQIVVFAGSQDGNSIGTTSTFVIGASAPYGIRSHISDVTPLVNPIVLTWSDNQAAILGGSTQNTKVMLFNPETEWSDSGATLAQPLTKDITAIRAILMNGDDGSKSLYTFDLTVSPNQVQRMVLIDAEGKPVPNSAPVSKQGTRRTENEFAKRALTLSDWPAYNSTLAPTGTRTNYALAQGSDGLVVFAGGSGASKDDAISMFDARQNSWEDASQKLNDQEVLITTESTTSTSSAITSSTATSSSASSFSTLPSSATASASASASAAVSSSAGTETASPAAGAAVSANAILGIVLGTITGIMILLGLILFCIRRRRGKNQQNVEGGQTARGFSDEKAGLGYGNDLSPGAHFRGHQQQDSAGSFSSMAILMGKVNSPKSGVPRSAGNRDTTTSFFKSTIGKPMPQTTENSALSPPSRDEKGVSFAADVVEPRPTPRGAPVGRAGETRRSSGWNRYWSGGSALNILGFGNSKRTTVDSERSSHYSTQKNRITQDSATVPPLHLITQDLSTVPPIQHDGRPELSRVVSGSPTVSNYSSQIPFRDGVSGKIESPRRPTSDASSGYSSGIPESVRDAWDPTEPSKGWGVDRAPSSVYAESLYPTSLAPSVPQRQTVFPSGVSQQPQLAMATTSSDMSWLNLGEINKAQQDRR
ncbi:hypothetical protein CCHL11_09966 [Colletotrichum chlorophyti]|uniref:Pre-mRNA splicing factor CLF1 n=1 Tax=Colletotrichum chlorophyti TaxID=708187 RepID=A0A1Q8RAP2_9PEZI|nr:hypothetical protein CCHL11_09966 [Colletotrichum chlorophyti]